MKLFRKRKERKAIERDVAFRLEKHLKEKTESLKDVSLCVNYDMFQKYYKKGEYYFNLLLSDGKKLYTPNPSLVKNEIQITNKIVEVIKAFIIYKLEIEAYNTYHVTISGEIYQKPFKQSKEISALIKALKKLCDDENNLVLKMALKEIYDTIEKVRLENNYMGKELNKNK